MQTTSEVLKELQSKTKVRPNVVSYTLSSPWYVSEVRHVHQEYEKETVITKKAIDTLVKEQTDDFLKFAKKEHADYLGGEALILDSEVMQVRLNGYEAKDPYRKKAHTLDVAVFVSVAADVMQEKLEKAIRAQYPNVRIESGSYMLPYYEATRVLYPDMSSYVLLDVSGEMTDVAVVNRGVITSSAAFSVGKHNLIRTLGDKLGTTPEDAWSRFALHMSEELADTDEKRVAMALAAFSKEWIDAFAATHKEKLSESVLPATVFLMADEVIADWLKRKVENGLSAVLPDKPQLKATLITSDFLEKGCTCVNTGSADAFLVVAALAAHQRSIAG
jgi:cell division ATPase FtsA